MTSRFKLTWNSVFWMLVSAVMAAFWFVLNYSPRSFFE